MGIKEGDRFINLNTGTIIKIDYIVNRPDVYFIANDEAGEEDRTITRDEWICKVSNLTDPSKSGEVLLDVLESIIESSTIIQYYNQEPIKPINYLKQYKLC
jgi:hypothetical protein